MTLLKTLLKGLLVTALALGAVVGGGYVGLVASGHGERSAAAEPTPSAAPSDSGSPTPSPTPSPATPSRTATEPPAPVLLLEPGDEGDKVRALQARLKEIAWYYGDVTGTYGAATVKAIKGFQAKREIPVTGSVDRETMDRLVGMTSAPTHEAMYNIEPTPGALDARCLTGRVLCIDKTSRTLRWVIDGHVITTLDARFGSTISNTPTREGAFSVLSMDADHVSRLFGSSMPFSMFFSGGQAVHYSSDFASVGYNGASHGCVNIRDYDGIKWLFSQVHIGDKVVVYWS